ncbi:MAG: SGNH/GDSL hydrolase family protein [Fimbriimonas sp.]
MSLSLPVVADAAAKGPERSRIGARLARGERLHIALYGTSLSSHGAWTDQLREALDRRYAGRIRWTNASGSGKNSDWGLRKLKERVLPLRADAVLLEFGVNDAVARFNLPVSRSRANLERMIDRIRQTNPKTEIILQVTNPVTGRPAGDSGYRPHLDNYYAMIRQVAVAKRTVLVDHEVQWRRAMRRAPHLFRQWLPDGLHPSPAGCANVVTPTLLACFGTKGPNVGTASTLRNGLPLRYLILVTPPFPAHRPDKRKKPPRPELAASRKAKLVKT